MKNILSLLVLVLVLTYSCNSSRSEKSLEDDQINAENQSVALDTSDMQSLSLSDYDLNLELKVPIVVSVTGEEIKPIIDHVDGDYLWFISIGEQFKLIIEDYAKEFNKVAFHLKDLERQKDVFNVTYLEKAPHLLFYKRELVENSGGKPTFHCFAEITIDDYNYVLRSEKFGGHEQVIRDMVFSIKTARPINT